MVVAMPVIGEGGRTQADNRHRHSRNDRLKELAPAGSNRREHRSSNDTFRTAQIPAREGGHGSLD
jgi:hypothetical protein